MDTNTEIEAFASYREKYLAMHPLPEMRALKRLDWKFVASLVWAAASVLTVAIITANEFYLIAKLNNVDTYIAGARAIVSLLSVEGGIVIASAIKAAVEQKYNPKLLQFSIYLSLAISVVAGLSATLKAVPGIDASFQLFLSYALLIVVGAGGSFVAWASGEVMGQQIAITMIDRELAATELEVKNKEYEDDLLASWTRSPERAIVTSDMRIAEQEARAKLRSVPTERRTNSEQNLLNNGSNEVALKISEFLRATFESEGRVPGPTEIHNELGVSKSYAKEVRDEWTANNASIL